MIYQKIKKGIPKNENVISKNERLFSARTEGLLARTDRLLSANTKNNQTNINMTKKVNLILDKVKFHIKTEYQYQFFLP